MKCGVMETPGFGHSLVIISTRSGFPESSAAGTRSILAPVNGSSSARTAGRFRSPTSGARASLHFRPERASHLIAHSRQAAARRLLPAISALRQVACLHENRKTTTHPPMLIQVRRSAKNGLEVSSPHEVHGRTACFHPLFHRTPCQQLTRTVPAIGGAVRPHPQDEFIRRDGESSCCNTRLVVREKNGESHERAGVSHPVHEGTETRHSKRNHVATACKHLGDLIVMLLHEIFVVFETHQQPELLLRSLDVPLRAVLHCLEGSLYVVRVHGCNQADEQLLAKSERLHIVHRQ